VVDLGIDLPAGHRLVSLAERPDLIAPAADHNTAAWPEFMFQDDVADRFFNRCWRDFPELQFVLLGSGDDIVATNNAMPLWWDGSDEGLPDGWDDQVIRSIDDLKAGRAPNTLGALQIVVALAARGGRYSGTMVAAMRSSAIRAGWSALIACVRPTAKDRYPLQPIESYAFWTRDDGLPFDPWIRLHARLGARVVKGAPRSMTMRGTVANWEKWTGMPLPESGDYVVPFATSPVHIDRARDEGVYYDQNVWMVHPL
jgi:hypothetical protein